MADQLNGVWAGAPPARRAHPDEVKPLPPPRSILQNQGKTVVLPVLPAMAPLVSLEYQCSVGFVVIHKFEKWYVMKSLLTFTSVLKVSKVFKIVNKLQEKSWIKSAGLTRSTIIHLVKFMFSGKATKFDEIFTVNLTLCSKCQIDC